jgi:uncharacterized OsmC-like protein
MPFHTARNIALGQSGGGFTNTDTCPKSELSPPSAHPPIRDTSRICSQTTEQAEIERSGEAAVCLAGRTLRVRSRFLDDIETQPQAARISAMKAALLVLHSPTDETVGVDNARQIFDSARHPKSFVAIDGADHLLTSHADANYVSAVLAAWASRYAFGPDAESPEQQLEEGFVEVSEAGAAPYGQRIAAGRHVLTADEPAPIGADTGPSPYDLLLAALGTCTSMTIRMYANRKQWPLNDVTVSLRHSRIHATDCATCETRTGRVDRFERVIRFHGDLDPEQRQRLLDIADKCPVHRTLSSEVAIETTEFATDRGAAGTTVS